MSNHLDQMKIEAEEAREEARRLFEEYESHRTPETFRRFAKVNHMYVHKVEALLDLMNNDDQLFKDRALGE